MHECSRFPLLSIHPSSLLLIIKRFGFSAGCIVYHLRFSWRTCRRSVNMKWKATNNNANDTKNKKIYKYSYTDMGSNWHFYLFACSLLPISFLSRVSVLRARVRSLARVFNNPHINCRTRTRSLGHGARARACIRASEVKRREQFTSYPDSLKWILNCSIIIISVPRKIVYHVPSSLARRPRLCVY